MSACALMPSCGLLSARRPLRLADPAARSWFIDAFEANTSVRPTISRVGAIFAEALFSERPYIVNDLVVAFDDSLAMKPESLFTPQKPIPRDVIKRKSSGVGVTPPDSVCGLV